MYREKRKEYQVTQLAKPGRSSVANQQEASKNVKKKGSKKKYCQGCRQGTQCQDKEYTTPSEPKQLHIQKQSGKPNTSTITCTITNTSTSTTSTTSSSIPSLPTASYAPGIEDFVPVTLHESKSVHLYMVEVLDITENEKEAHLRFIKKYGNDLYIERKISRGSQFKKT